MLVTRFVLYEVTNLLSMATASNILIRLGIDQGGSQTKKHKQMKNKRFGDYIIIQPMMSAASTPDLRLIEISSKEEM